jgi:sugar lactone lactonase YvrE
MVTDEQGTLWIAMWGGHQVRRYSPAGDLLSTVDLPSAQPTSVALLGERAVVTTARTGLEHPQAADGLLLAIDLPALGIEATGRRACAFGRPQDSPG